MSHPNAPLTPEGRRRLCERVDVGRAISHVAAEAGVSRQTLGKWHERWTVEGEEGLADRSSRPASSPMRTPVEIEDRVEALRRSHKLGPVQLMGLLASEGIELTASTIYRILVRRGIRGFAISTTRAAISASRSFATSGLAQATWSTSTSRSSDASLKAAHGP